MRTVRHGRHRILLVHHREVVEDALLIDVHPPDAVLDDHRDLVRERGVVGEAVRVGHGEEMRLAILMLQAFAGERRAPGRPAEHEAARP